jgi:hypothetical protein
LQDPLHSAVTAYARNEVITEHDKSLVVNGFEKVTTPLPYLLKIHAGT